MSVISVPSTNFLEHTCLPSRIQWIGVLWKWGTHILPEHCDPQSPYNLYVYSRCALMEAVALAKLALLIRPVEQCTLVQVLRGECDTSDYITYYIISLSPTM